jgi:Zn-dependent M32 family carboxypeptidase
MRGQLIDAPSYLMNYALGAFITADLRARIQALHGEFTLGDSTWYGFVRDRIYRFGLERSSLRVMEDFLGRPLSPEPLLADLRRGIRPGMRGPAH